MELRAGRDVEKELFLDMMMIIQASVVYAVHGNEHFKQGRPRHQAQDLSRALQE